MHLPTLRERRDDIPLLAEHFLSKYAEQMKKPVTSISADAMFMLQEYAWPGNVRELENVIERAVALEPSPAVLSESLPPHVRTASAVATGAVALSSNPESRMPDAGAIPPLPDLGEGFDLEARGEDF